MDDGRGAAASKAINATADNGGAAGSKIDSDPLCDDPAVAQHCLPVRRPKFHDSLIKSVCANPAVPINARCAAGKKNGHGEVEDNLQGAIRLHVGI